MYANGSSISQTNGNISKWVEGEGEVDKWELCEDSREQLWAACERGVTWAGLWEVWLHRLTDWNWNWKTPPFVSTQYIYIYSASIVVKNRNTICFIISYMNWTTCLKVEAYYKTQAVISCERWDECCSFCRLWHFFPCNYWWRSCCLVESSWSFLLFQFFGDSLTHSSTIWLNK